MKIALVCRVTPQHRPGGLPFVAFDRARALAAAGNDVHLLTTSRHAGRGEELHIDGIEVHFMPCKPLVYSKQFAQHCETHCKAFEPNIIHLDSLDLNHRWYLDRPGGPDAVVLTLHGFCFGAYLTRWNMYRSGEEGPPTFDAVGALKESEIFRQFDTVIGISRHEHWMLRDLCGVQQAKLVYNPLPAYFFDGVTDPSPLDSPRRFLCAAVSGQRERGFHIAKSAAAKAGVELIEVSKVPREQMPAVVDKCSAVVLPTRWGQGYDLAICEAIARRRPVIVSAVGSYLRESEPLGSLYGYSIVADSCDVDGFAAAMRYELPAVGDHAADRFRPENHVANWLGAIGV